MMIEGSSLFQKEKDLTEVVRDWLNSQQDIKADKICDRYKKGIPDFIVCVRGKYVAIELKAETGVSSAHQRLFIREVIRAGGIGGTCYTLNDVKDLVERARR